MESPVGRREASKRATRAAIERAARELFARGGFDGVTVREIADAAGVTERTFYRYFPSKYDLVADDARAWAEVLSAAIAERPAPEPSLLAVERAIVALMQLAIQRPDELPVWLLHDRPRPFELLGQADQRALVRFEEAIADGLRGRGGGQHGQGSRNANGLQESAELAARVAVAVIRTATIRRRALEREGAVQDPVALLEREFARLAALTSGR